MHYILPITGPVFRLETSPTPIIGQDILIAERILEAYQAAKRFEEANVPPQLLQRRESSDDKPDFLQEFESILDSRDPTDVAVHLCQACRLPTAQGFGLGKRAFDAATATGQEAEFAAIVMERVLAVARSMTLLPQGSDQPNTPESIEELLERIESAVGAPIDIGPVMGRFGVRLGERVLDPLAADSAYAIWRMRMLLDDELEHCRVAEIGAGLARTAQLAATIGIQQYSIFDLPTANALQGYYLLKTCEPGKVQLFGEINEDAPIKVQPYWEFFDTPEGYFDLCLSHNSIHAMSETAAKSYVLEMPRVSRLLLSINKEELSAADNQSTLRPLSMPRLVEDHPGFKRTGRHPYWVRPGYVEEVYRMSSSQAGEMGRPNPFGSKPYYPMTRSPIEYAISGEGRFDGE